jgi:hypothetical protein
MAIVSSTDFVCASERPTAIAASVTLRHHAEGTFTGVFRQTVAGNRITRHTFVLEDLQSQADGARQNNICGELQGHAA